MMTKSRFEERDAKGGLLISEIIRAKIIKASAAEASAEALKVGGWMFERCSSGVRWKDRYECLCPNYHLINLTLRDSSY